MAWRHGKEERNLDNKIKVEKRRREKKGKVALGHYMMKQAWNGLSQS